MGPIQDMLDSLTMLQHLEYEMQPLLFKTEYNICHTKQTNLTYKIFQAKQTNFDLYLFKDF